MTAQEIIDKVRAAMEHIEFTIMLCEKQVKAGRLFLFEHPVQARSWNLKLVKRLFKYNRVCTVDFDFCQLGMQSEGRPVKKRTRTMTNSPTIANRLAKFQCDGSHWHIPLVNGRASACQVYPREFCAQICLGLKDELAAKQLGGINLGTLDVMQELLEVFEPHPHDTEAATDRATMEYLYSGKEFWDDLSGKWLEKNRAIEARRLELEFFKKMGGLR